MSFEWTPQVTAILIALWDEGLTTSKIGERLGITKNAVIGKVHRLGLPKRVVVAARKPLIKKAEGVKLEALRTGMCCWPDGDPGTDSLSFCAQPVVSEKPYCAEHCARAYVKTSKDRAARKDRAA